MPERFKKAFFYLVLVLIPIIFILLLEISLRLLNYGKDYSTFVVLEDLSEQYYLNPDLPYKYFNNTASVPSVIPDPFDIKKAGNSIRIFVFGGSTTAGYPYSPNISFPRIIKRKLELIYPENKIEVVNLGLSAANSHFIRDILPDVIEQKPDLLIFYTGHNEYFGALGAASSEFISSYPGFVQFVLDLREFKTYQLIQSITKGITSIFVSEKNPDRTLMGEMIKEREVLYNSETYNDGMNQFKKNLNVIFDECSRSKIPVIAGALTSNLMQLPLGKSKEAGNYYSDGVTYRNNGDSQSALFSLKKAVDYDPLKFRAPSGFNTLISESLEKFNFTTASVEQEFLNYSPNGITDTALFVDHLHPNIAGYKLMADVFYAKADSIISLNFSKNTRINENSIDNYLEENFPFTRYDSTLAELKLYILLNDFPFKNSREYNLHKYSLITFEDSLAMKSVTEGLGWAAAHIKIFDYYYSKKNYERAGKALFALMEARPFYKSALEYAIPKLIKTGRIKESKHILVRNYNRQPCFFTSKNLGIINLNEGNLPLANKLLQEAAGFKGNDAEVYFHLARSFYGLKEIGKAIENLKLCLAVQPGYPGAKDILNRITSSQK